VTNSRVEFYDDEFDHEESLSLSESEAIAEEFKNNAKALVLKHICNYFQNKSLHTGGKIPTQILKTEKRISLVLNSDMCTGIDRAYAALESSCPSVVQTKKVKEQIPVHYEQVKTVLDNICKSRIPKEFAGGILCLHLELVDGVVFES
jgi:uncharacterized glyoxalase superfamily protein PhnB